MYYLLSDLLYTMKYKGENRTLAFVKGIMSGSFIVMFVYRLSHVINNLRIPIIPKLLWWLNFIIFKVDIDYRAVFQGGVYMPHPMNIVIGDGVYIKGNIKIMHSVTIGGNLGKVSTFNGQLIKQPHFLEGGFLGINAIIAGPIILKSKVFISANSLVSKSFDKSCYLFGVNKVSDLNEAHIFEMK